MTTRVTSFRESDHPGIVFLGNVLSGKMTIRETTFQETSFREKNHPGKVSIRETTVYRFIIIKLLMRCWLLWQPVAVFVIMFVCHWFFCFMHSDKLIWWWWWWVNLWLFALIFALQQYIAPVMSIFGPLNNPTNAYNNYRVYGTILCFLMFVCVFIGVKFVSKFSPVALLCVIFSIACVYIGIFVANPDRGPKYVFDLFLLLTAGIWCVKSST